MDVTEKKYEEEESNVSTIIFVKLFSFNLK